MPRPTKSLALLAFTTASLLAPVAHAQEWSTATHLGLGIVDRSTTGFEKVAGSLVFLDVARRVAPQVEVGLRTSAMGGQHGEGAYYRLGTGPLVSWKVNESLTLQASVARFDESAQDEDGNPLYRSRGASGLIGWEHTRAFGPRVEAAWGGFLTQHRGALQPAAAGVTTAGENAGYGHGLEACLRVRL